MSAAMMPSTVEFRMRSRNSVVRRSSRSSSRASVTSRNEKIAAACSDRMPIEATDTVRRSPDVVTISRSKLSTGSARVACKISASRRARWISGTICVSGRPAKPSRAYPVTSSAARFM